MTISMKTAAACIAGGAVIASAIPAAADAPNIVERSQLGSLICDVGRSSEEHPSLPSTAVPSIKQELHCVIRNRETGALETYSGNFKVVGSLATIPRKNTLLWDVSVTPGTKLTAGVLEQTYEAQPNKINKARVKVIGEAKPGVSLRLITDERKKEPPLPVLSLKLSLISSSA